MSRIGHPDCSTHEFTQAFTAPIVATACRIAGLDPTDTTVIRHHTNAVYKLASAPVVVKINRPGSQAPARVVALMPWLYRHGIDASPLWPGLDQPLHISGCQVTLWRYLPQDREISAIDFAEPLARLHGIRDHSVILPVHDPMDGVEQSIALSRILDDTHRNALYEWCEAAKVALSEVEYHFPTSVIHGDAQHRNALWHSDMGRAVLADWDNAAYGQPEWDAVTVEVHCRRFGYPPSQYARFCDISGFNVRDWPGYDTLRSIRELRMITTNARKSAPGSAAAGEVLRRITEQPEIWYRL